MLLGVHSVMHFVEDPAAALDWYAGLLETEPVEVAPDYRVLPIGGVELCFHRADRLVPSGAAGTVTYWQVDVLASALARALAMGACLHRGPLEIEGGRAICQVRDPFGDLLGLIGAAGPA